MDSSGGSSQTQEKTDKIDRRSRKTKAALTKALMELLQTKPLNEITIKQLTDAADINRSTFYIHFQDIYDLMQYVRREICNKSKEIVSLHKEEVKHNDFKGLIKDVLLYMTSNDGVLLILQQENVPNGISSVSGEVAACLKEACLEVIRPLEKVSDKNLKAIEGSGGNAADIADYHIDYLFGGVFSIINSWFMNGKKEPLDFIIALTTVYFDAVSFNSVLTRTYADLSA